MDIESTLKYGDDVKFSSRLIGHLVYGEGVVWEIVRSGDVIDSMSPESPIMVARWVHPKQTSYVVCQTSIDYFKSDFMYITTCERLDYAKEFFQKAVDDGKL
jgi:hypothetical protein